MTQTSNPSARYLCHQDISLSWWTARYANGHMFNNNHNTDCTSSANEQYSTIRYAFLFSDDFISWNCKRQQIMFSFKSEKVYMIINQNMFLRDMKLIRVNASIIMCDNSTHHTLAQSVLIFNITSFIRSWRAITCTWDIDQQSTWWPMCWQTYLQGREISIW